MSSERPSPTKAKATSALGAGANGINSLMPNGSFFIIIYFIIGSTKSKEINLSPRRRVLGASRTSPYILQYVWELSELSAMKGKYGGKYAGISRKIASGHEYCARGGVFRAAYGRIGGADLSERQL
jgi:hypothetical protein